MSTLEQRSRWRQRATWLTQLGLAEGEPTPDGIAEELADAVLVLLAEVQQRELDRSEVGRPRRAGHRALRPGGGEAALFGHHVLNEIAREGVDVYCAGA